ncbi:MAG: BrnT family toxin [Candidatus Aquicultor sp.]
MAIRVTDFEWDDGNTDHLAEHGVTPDEAEEAVYDKRYVGRTRQKRLVFLGQTDAGRYLKVICQLKGSIARVITAYDMDENDKQFCKSRGK